jgi:nucleoside-diphosphate kinase
MSDMRERTLTIFKPDAVSSGRTGAMLARLEEEGFRVRGLKRLRLTPEQARAFYAVHRERPFFEGLVRFMTEGPIVAAALERENAVAHLRATMGATDSKKAEPGTLRRLYGTDIERNAIHGSDSAENATKEVAFFFSEAELV